MKFALLFLTVFATAFAANDTPTPAVIPGFVYIRDATKFAGEDSKQLTPDGRRALKFARAVLALRLEREIEGKFSVAEATWGYQVNFSALKIKKDGSWSDVTEGFGEIFLSKKLDRIQIDYGP